MNTRITITYKIIILLVLSIGLILPAANASAASLQFVAPGKIVAGGYFSLAESQALNGNLLVLGGTAALQSGSTVNGDVIVLGGNLKADGLITGDVLALGGVIEMSSSTVVRGDVNAVGGTMQGVSQASIGGSVNSSANPVLPFIVPNGLRIPLPNVDIRFNPLWDFLWLLIQAFLWAALAVVVVLVAPKPTRRVGDAVFSQPVISGGLGLVTAVIVPIMLALIALTIICIPLTLFGVIILVLAWAFGLISIGVEIGERLGKMGHSDWALPVSAALGTFLVVFIINTVGKIIPCIGWIFPFLVGVIGLGAVLLTRFGTRSYPIDIVPVTLPTTNDPPQSSDETGQEPPVEN